jgi:hypothetical protein
VSVDFSQDPSTIKSVTTDVDKPSISTIAKAIYVGEIFLIIYLFITFIKIDVPSFE